MRQKQKIQKKYVAMQIIATLKLNSTHYNASWTQAEHSQENA